MSYRPALAAASLVMVLLHAAPRVAAQQEAASAASFAEGPTDSLAFALKRQKILEGAPDIRLSALLEAAEELARDGYYSEALELVYDLEDAALAAGAAEDFLADSLPETAFSDSGTAPTHSSPSKAGALLSSAWMRELRSYVRSSFEYNPWDSTMPYGGEVRAKLEWLPDNSFMERITPTFAGSDRRTFFGLAGKGAAFRRMLKVEAEALGEKRLWQTYGDSLDRLHFQGLVEAGTRPLGKAVSFTLPLRGEVEEYREGRLGLLSRRSASASPTLEAVSTDWRRSLLLSWDTRWYHYPTSPASGFIRNGPFLLANWYGNRFTLEAEAQYLDDHYSRDTSLFASRSWETRLAAYLRPNRSIKAGIRLFRSAEDGSYRDILYLAMLDSNMARIGVPVQARYDLEGATSTVQPVMTMDWSIYSGSLSVAYSRGRFPMLAAYEGNELYLPQFIGEDYQGWKPEATFSILSKRLFLNLSLGYEMHQPSSSIHYLQRYSDGLDMGGNFSWKINPWVEVDLSGLWIKRLAGTWHNGRILNMKSLSIGLTSRFN